MKKAGLFLLLVLVFGCVNKKDEPLWNNPIDINGINFKQPKIITMGDTIVSIYDTFAMHFTYVKGNAKLLKVYWGINDTFWDEINKDTILYKFFIDSGKYKIYVKALDSLGIYSDIDSFTVTTGLFPPVLLKHYNDTIIKISDTLYYNILADDEDSIVKGGIKNYYFIRNGYADTLDTSYVKLFFHGYYSDTIVLGVSDDDNICVYDTFYVQYNIPPDTVYFLRPILNDTVDFDNFSKDSKKGSYKFIFSAHDYNIPEDTLFYKLWISLDSIFDSSEVVYFGKDTFFLYENLLPSAYYFIKLSVYDLMNDSQVVKGMFFTQFIDTIKPVITLNGDDTVHIPLAYSFVEPGYSATDNGSIDITDSVKVIGLELINTKSANTYTLTYTVSDNFGNSDTAYRYVVIDEYILLDNFDDNIPYKSSFGALFDKFDSTGNWIVWHDYSTVLEPDPANSSIFMDSIIIDSVGYLKSKALVDWIRIYEPANAYFGFGCYIKKNDEYYDLSAMDSIVFYAKAGPKSAYYGIRVEFTYPAIDTIEGDKWGYVGKNVTITNSLQRYVILPSELKGVVGSPGENHVWDMVKDNIRMIQFVENPEESIDDLELYLDEIRIYGSFSNSPILDK